MQEKFNQTDYIREYNKKNYSQFKATLKKKDREELNELLKKHGLNKTQFVLKAKELLEKGKLK